MSISAVLHSRAPGAQITPMTRESLRSSVSQFATDDRIKKFGRHGKTGAKIFGAMLLATMLSAYSPDAAAQYQDPVNTLTVFSQVVQYAQTIVPNGAQFASEAAAGASQMAHAVAYHVNDTVVAPSMGAVRANGNDLSQWAASQRDAAVQLGTSLYESAKEIAAYLVPKTKGEIVERGILILAALKSFSEGVSLLGKGAKSILRRVTGRKEEEPAAAATAEPVTKIEVHHHHYYGTAPTPPADPNRMIEGTATPIQIEDTRADVEVDAANDNDYGSPHA